MMLLRNKLNDIHMSKIETVASYLVKIAKLCDQPATIGEEVKSEELVLIALNG
jgi:hypothetical protein